MNTTPQRNRTPVRAALAGLCSAFLLLEPLAATPVWAAPQGIKVVRGRVKVKERGNRTVIKASNRAIIKYKNFDIAHGEKVRFIQPGRNARVLNRVTGPGATQIEGALSANGRVYIVNKQGVRIGEGAIVHVGGLVAAAGDISNRDFAAGVDRFVDLEGSVENRGEIVADEAYLIGRYVENQGVVLSDDGLVTMVAGEDVYIGHHGDAVLVKIDASEMADAGRAGVEQGGVVDAGDGEVILGAGDLYSLAVRVPGEVRAHRIRVEGHGSGEVEVSGRLDASSAKGRGGEIEVLGQDVALRGADVDASGTEGGGTILVGGAYQGGGSERSAETTLLDEESALSADATGKGDGGEIVVWADGSAGVHGRISARGAGGGRGGSVETSGKEMLDLTTSPSLGEGGQWLIDPRDLTIVADGAGTSGIDDNATPTPSPVPPTSTTGDFRASSPSATLEVGLILEALTDGADVTVFTGGGSSGGNQPGDLTVATPIDYDGTGSNTLRLLARNDVVVDAGSTISDSTPGDGDLLNLELAADIGDGNVRNAGDGNGDVVLRDSIETNGGFFLSSGQDFILGDGGNTANVTTGAGDITLDHQGTVHLDDGALTAAGGAIGIGASSGTSDITVAAGSLVTSNGSSVTLTAGRDIDLSTTGDLAADAGLALAAGGDVVLAAAGSQTLDGGSGVLETSNDLVKTAGDLTLSGSSISLTRNASDQVLEATAGTLALTASATKSNEGTLNLRGGSGITLSGDVAGTATDTGNTGLVLADDVTLDAVGVDQRLDAGVGTLRIAGDVTKAVGGGFTLASSAPVNPIRMNGVTDQTLDAGPGILTIESRLVKTVANNLHLRGAQVSAASDIVGIDGLVVETGLDLTGASRQTIDSGTGALELQADLGKSAGADGLVLAAGGGLVLNDAVAQELGSGTGTLETDLDIVKGGVETLTLTGGGVDLTATGAQQIGAGGALVIDTSVAKTGAGTLGLDGATVALSGDATGSGDIVLGTDLTLTGAATQTIDAVGGTLHVPGDIVKNGVGADGGFALGGEVVFEGAGLGQQLDAGTGTLAIGGNVSKTVAGGYTLLGSDVVLDGAGAQTLSADQDAITVGSALSPIDVDKTTAGGLTLDAPTVELYGDVTSSQGLTLASGSSIDLLGTGQQSLDAGTGVLDVQVDLAKVGSGGFALGGDGGIAFSAAGVQNASAAGQTLALTDSATKTGGGPLGLTAADIELGGGVQGDADASGVAFDGDVVLAGAGENQQLDGNGGTLSFSGDVSKAVAGGYTLLGSDVSLVGATDQTVSADLDAVTVGSAGTPVAIAKAPATGALVLGGNRVELSADTSAENLDLEAATIDLIGNGSQTLESTASALQVGGDIVSTGSGTKTLTGAAAGVVFDGAGDQSASASAAETLDLPVAVAKTTPGDLTLGGARVSVQTGVDVATGALAFDGNATVASDLSASDGITFAGSLGLVGGAAQTLDGGTGGIHAVDVTSGNPVSVAFQSAMGTEIGGDLFTTGGSVAVTGDLTLGGDATVQEGIGVTGDMTVTGSGTRTVDTGNGVLDVAGSLDVPNGGLHVTRNLQVDGDVTAAGLLDIDEGATVGGALSAVGIDSGASLLLTSIGEVVVDGNGGDLRVTSGDLLADSASRLTLQTAGSGEISVENGEIRTAGDLTIKSPLTAKDVTVGDDALIDAPATITGLLATAGNARFRESLELGGDIEAGGSVRLSDQGATLAGKGGQHIQAGRTIVSRGTISKTTNGTLTLKASSGIQLAHRVSAKRDLVLDGFDPSSGPPEVATIYNDGGDLDIRSKQGSIRIEGDERISSPHGNLTLRAENGSITVGDLAAFERVTVDSPDIAIRPRSGGTVLTASGVAKDRGPDIVARSVVFSSRPQNAKSLNVATPSGQPVSQTLSGATVRTLEESFDQSLLVSNDGSTVFDPAASGTPRSNLGGVVAAESASLFTEQTALLQSLNEVAVSAKPLWASEVVAFLECGLYDADDPDLPAECEGFAAEDQSTEDERFQSASAKSALETYRFIFSQVDDIRDSFQQAANDFKRETGGQPLEGVAFRSYLEANRGSHEQALGYFDRLADLFGQMESMGLGGPDFQEARELLLDEVAPSDMDAVELDEAIRGSEDVEPGGPGRASTPLFAGAPLPGARKWWDAELRESTRGR